MIYKQDNMTIYKGDCLEVMKDIESNSIDLTVTSPPYDNLRTYKDSLEWGEHIWKPLISELYRATKKGGVVVWVVGDATIKGSETGTSFKQALFFKECGFNLNDTMIWNKGSFTAVGALRSRYAQVFEYMFILTKGKSNKFNPIKDRENKTKGRINGNIRQKDGSMKKAWSSGRARNKHGQRFNIWHMSNTDRSAHPAVFPEKLAQDHIISWSNKGDTVLDPFMGSGTVGKVCKKLGRSFIGIEKVEEYYEIAKERINKEPDQLELF